MSLSDLTFVWVCLPCLCLQILISSPNEHFMFALSPVGITVWMCLRELS